MSAFKCHVCGGTVARERTVSEVLDLDGRRVLVERIPAVVCTRCGEAVFAKEITERIRRLVHGAGQPSRTIPLEVFEMWLIDPRVLSGTAAWDVVSVGASESEG